MTGGSGDTGTAICAALAGAGCDVARAYVGNTGQTIVVDGGMLEP